MFSFCASKITSFSNLAILQIFIILISFNRGKSHSVDILGNVNGTILYAFFLFIVELFYS